MEGCRWLKKLHVHDKRVPERILQLLARYEETLKISNPGTQYNLDTKSDGHFKYVYMAMGEHRHSKNRSERSKPNEPTLDGQIL